MKSYFTKINVKKRTTVLNTLRHYYFQTDMSKLPKFSFINHFFARSIVREAERATILIWWGLVRSNENKSGGVRILPRL